MSRLPKILLLETWFLIWFVILGGVTVIVMRGPLAGNLGEYAVAFVLVFLFACWCWQLFVYGNYRFCRQEEFLHLLQTAATAQAPIEVVLRAHLRDRPNGEAYRLCVGVLLFFVFPGYYWIHQQRSFDVRLRRLTSMLQSGATLNQALRLTPGLVSREVALAVAVGQLSGNLPQALTRIPDRRLALQWLELGPRLVYPFIILMFMTSSLTFMMIFIVPKFEKIFFDFKMRLPWESEVLIAGSRWFGRYGIFVVLLLWLLLILFNLVLFSSRVRWYLPGVSWLYRPHARGQFLHVLGHLLETGKPLPEILAALTEAGLLPSVVAAKARDLAADIDQGRSLAEGLQRTGLAAGSTAGLIASAEKAQNLPWALQELGASLTRRSARLCQVLTMVFFPLGIGICAILIGFICVAMFTPLVDLIEGMAARD